jgi:hypothetical protein
LIPILNSFLVNKNQSVSLKATDLLNLMEKKILAELFECEGDGEVFSGIMSSAPKGIDGVEYDIMKHLKGDTIESGTISNMIPTTASFKSIKRHDVVQAENKKPLIPSITNSPLKPMAKRKKVLKRQRLLPNVYLKVNTNIVNNNGSSIENLSSMSKQSLVPFDNKQTNLLFKGYLFNEELQDCTEKLQKGLFCDEFYQNTYNKFNNLEQRLAWKRKKVCKKLLHILKVLVSIGVNFSYLRLMLIY